MSAIDRISQRAASIFTPPEDRLTAGALAERVRDMLPLAGITQPDTPMGDLATDLLIYLDGQEES